MTTFRATPELLNSLLTGIGPNYIKDGFLSFDRIKMETRDKTCTVKLYLEGVSLAVAEISTWAEEDTVEVVIEEGVMKVFLDDPELAGKKDIINISRIAREELERERRRDAIDAYKETLKSRKPLWTKIFPWTIRIERRK